MRKNFFTLAFTLGFFLWYQVGLAAPDCELDVPKSTKVGECVDNKGLIHPFVVLGKLNKGLFIKEVVAFILFADSKTESYPGLDPEKTIPMSKKWGENAYMTELGRKESSRRISSFSVQLQDKAGSVKCRIPPGKNL